MEPFHRRLKKLREEKGLTVKDAASLIGVPMTTYRDWEYGHAVTGEPYVKIAKAFGVSLNWLFDFDEGTTLSPTERIDRVVHDLQQLKSEISSLLKK